MCAMSIVSAIDICCTVALHGAHRPARHADVAEALGVHPVVWRRYLAGKHDPGLASLERWITNWERSGLGDLVLLVDGSGCGAFIRVR